MRIAMWSGPRNLSTAMMYAFGSRADTAVWDEPFYAPYLKATGRPDPLRDEVLAAEETDPDKVAERCLGPIPDGKTVFYQKHMPFQMIAGFPRDWIFKVTNVFLIRHPARVISSYVKKRENPVETDLGYVMQNELFDDIATRTGKEPVVIDSADIRRDPEGMLGALCDAIGLAFDPAMLSWPAGGHPNDGAWAPHWYPEIWTSTGFAGAEGGLPEVPDSLRRLLDETLPHYERLRALALRS